MSKTVPAKQNFTLFDVGSIVLTKHYECHDYYVLVFTRAGKSEVEVGKKTYQLSENSICLIYPGTLYKINSSHPNENYRLYFRPSSLGNTFLSTPSFTQIKKLLDTEATLAFFEGLDSYLFMEKISVLEFSFNFEHTLRLLDIFHYLSSQNKSLVLPTDKTTVKSLSSYKHIMDLTRYLAKNLEQVNSLSDAAAMCLMSESKFSKVFKMITGTSYKHYLIEMRLHHAYQMLLNTELSISQISLQVGFPTISNFNTQFRKTYDIAPSELRNERNFLNLLDSKLYPDMVSGFNGAQETKRRFVDLENIETSMMNDNKEC